MNLIAGALLGIIWLVAIVILCYTLLLILKLCFAINRNSSEQADDECYYKVNSNTIETERSYKVKCGTYRNN